MVESADINLFHMAIKGLEEFPAGFVVAHCSVFFSVKLTVHVCDILLILHISDDGVQSDLGGCDLCVSPKAVDR